MERNRYIDYLKAAGIIFVIITHNTIAGVIRKELLFPFWITMAVPLFITISGINFANSIENRGIRTLKGWFGINNLYARFIRVLLPFVIIYVFQVIWRVTLKNVKYTPWRFIKEFLMGGYGSGSYYVCIMMQLIIIFPICYFIIKENYKIGIPLIISLNLIFEFAVHYYHMNEDYYRLSVFRYLTYIALGIFICMRKRENKPIKKLTLFISFIVGVFYLLEIGYFGYKASLFTYWTSTAIPSAFFVFPIIYLVIGIKEPKEQSMAGEYFALIGKASYHIFLIQMTYYYLQIDEKFIYPLSIFIGILICTSAGILFYLFDTKWLTGRINTLFEKRVLQKKRLSV